MLEETFFHQSITLVISIRKNPSVFISFFFFPLGYYNLQAMEIMQVDFLLYFIMTINVNLQAGHSQVNENKEEEKEVVLLFWSKDNDLTL